MAFFNGTPDNDKFNGTDSANTFTTGGGGNDEFTSGGNSDLYVIDLGADGFVTRGKTTIVDNLGRDVLDLTEFVAGKGPLGIEQQGFNLVLTNSNGGSVVVVNHFLVTPNPANFLLQNNFAVEQIDFARKTVDLRSGFQVIDIDATRTAINNLIATTDRRLVFVKDDPVITLQEDGANGTFDLATLVKDLDGDAVTFSVVAVAPTIAASINGSVLTIDPAADIFGPAKIGILASANGNTVEFNLPVNIQGVNDAPVALADSALLALGQNSVVIDVLTNDRDPEGEALSIVELLAAPNVDILANGTLRYNRVDGAGEVDTFGYTIKDASGATTRAEVQVTIQTDPNAPLAIDDSVVASAKQLTKGLKISVLANDTNAIGKKGFDLASLKITDQPDHGTLKIAKGKVTFVANASFDGTDSFDYTIADKAGRVSDIATVVITGPDII